jgi:hypothetical protein
MLKDKPEAVRIHQQDFAKFVAVLRAAAVNLNLLATAMTNYPSVPEPVPEAVKQREEQDAQQDVPDPAAFLNEEPGPESSNPAAETAGEAHQDPKNAQKAANCSKVIYEPIRGGPKVLEVAIPGRYSYDPPTLKYYVCVGEQKYPYLTLDEAKTGCDKFAGEQSQKPRNEQAKKQTVRAQGVAQRYRLAEHTMGDLTELVIMDGDKVHDCYSLDAIEEALAAVDKLNKMSAAAGPQEGAIAG